jgi:8-oxo-dGTP diphosphatase
MQQYVAGLLFDDDASRVALVLKNRPAWQAGNFNAIGGKIEEGEGPSDAMVREFAEEAGVELEDWYFQFVLTRPEEYEVYFFAAWNTDALDHVVTREDEPIFILDPYDLPENVIFNIRWIIPLVLDQTVAKPEFFEDIAGN